MYYVYITYKLPILSILLTRKRPRSLDINRTTLSMALILIIKIENSINFRWITEVSISTIVLIHSKAIQWLQNLMFTSCKTHLYLHNGKRFVQFRFQNNQNIKCVFWMGANQSQWIDFVVAIFLHWTIEKKHFNRFFLERME